MTFTPKDWVDSPSTSTPITAAALEDLETRLAAYADSVSGGSDTLTGSVQTTDDTPTNIDLGAIPAGEAWVVRLAVIANGPDAGDAAWGAIDAASCVVSNTNGNARLQQGANLGAVSGGSLPLPFDAAAAAVVGGHLVVTVAGLAATAINWRVKAHITRADAT